MAEGSQQQLLRDLKSGIGQMEWGRDELQAGHCHYHICIKKNLSSTTVWKADLGTVMENEGRGFGEEADATVQEREEEDVLD